MRVTGCKASIYIACLITWLMFIEFLEPQLSEVLYWIWISKSIHLTIKLELTSHWHLNAGNSSVWWDCGLWDSGLTFFDPCWNCMLSHEFSNCAGWDESLAMDQFSVLLIWFPWLFDDLDSRCGVLCDSQSWCKHCKPDNKAHPQIAIPTL